VDRKHPAMNRWKLILVLLVFTGLSLGDKVNAQSTHEITISAAISLKNAYEEIGKIFMERNPGVKVIFNFGASGDLARQIEAGAPVDLFASAAQKDMDDIDRKGLITPKSRQDFIGNAVVLVKPAHSNIPLQSLRDLRRKEVQKVVIGNPKTVPAGRYAEEVLRHFNLWDAIKEKLIFAEHVRQALDYVARDEVDAGLVYSTDAMVRSKEVTLVTQAPEGSHQPIIYPIAALKGAKDEKGARKFVEYVLSAEAQKVLKQYGFTPLSQ
jgi:molybdate transport system substrate-binding protein